MFRQVIALFALAAVPASHATPPRVVFNHGAPHVPNLLVVARAVSVDIAMRAAGARRISRLGPVESSGASAPGQLYTDNPRENRTRQTPLDPGADVVPAVRRAWPEIGERGARTLAAQFAIETGAGRHCYNFNLGNHKAGANEPHMYLRGVWEGVSRRAFEQLRADATFGGFVREEAPREIAERGHVVSPGNIVVALDPPHPAARFRANATLDEGVGRFVALHQRFATRVPTLLSALRGGDARSVARILASSDVRYFTGDVDAYAQGMIDHREIIDEGLGPSP